MKLAVALSLFSVVLSVLLGWQVLRLGRAVEQLREETSAATAAVPKGPAMKPDGTFDTLQMRRVPLGEPPRSPVAESPGSR